MGDLDYAMIWTLVVGSLCSPTLWVPQHLTFIDKFLLNVEMIPVIMVPTSSVLYPFTTMETFYAWKHDINDTGKNASSYTPVRAKSIEEAHIKARKHFKYDFFYSRFKVSVMSHDGHQYISNVGNDILP